MLTFLLNTIQILPVILIINQSPTFTDNCLNNCTWHAPHEEYEESAGSDGEGLYTIDKVYFFFLNSWDPI